MVSGMDPESLLLSSDKTVTDVKDPMEAGRVPVRFRRVRILVD